MVESRFMFIAIIFSFGLFSCEAQNSSLIAPNITTAPLSQVNKSCWSNVTFTCHVNGNPLPQVTWFKNGDKLLNVSSNTMIRGDNNDTIISILYLQNITKGDEGNYSCFAINSEGSATSLSAGLAIICGGANQNGSSSSSPGRQGGSTSAPTGQSGTVASASATTNGPGGQTTTSSSGAEISTSGSENQEGSTTSSSTHSQGGSNATSASSEQSTSQSSGGENSTSGGASQGGSTTASSGGGENSTTSSIGSATSSSGGGGGGSTSSSGGGASSTSSGGSEEKEIAEAQLKCTFQKNYTAALCDNSTKEFRDFKEEIDKPVLKTLGERLSVIKENSGLVSCSKGSVVAQFVIHIDKKASNLPSNTTLESEMEKVIMEANASNSLGGIPLLGVQVTKITIRTVPVTNTQPPNVPSDDDDSGLKGWEIALIVIFVLILIGIIAFVAFMIFYKKESAENAKELEEYPPEEDHNYAQVNENVYDNPSTDWPDQDDPV